MNGVPGQARNRQIDCLKDLGAALGNEPDGALWSMRNGYAICNEAGLAAIDARLQACEPSELDALRARLRVGLHWQVELTDTEKPDRCVTQAYCSALPVSCCHLRVPAERWRPFATPVLEAAYEATLLAALLNRERTGCVTVFLTRLGAAPSATTTDGFSRRSLERLSSRTAFRST